MSKNGCANLQLNWHHTESNSQLRSHPNCTDVGLDCRYRHRDILLAETLTPTIECTVSIIEWLKSIRWLLASTSTAAPSPDFRHSVVEQVAGDDHAHDFAGPFKNLVDPHVAEKAFDR